MHVTPPLRSGQLLEYKYVVVNSDGNVGMWKPGHNYQLEVRARAGQTGPCCVASMGVDLYLLSVAKHPRTSPAPIFAKHPRAPHLPLHPHRCRPRRARACA